MAGLVAVVINRRAERKYEELVSALAQVSLLVEECRRLVNALADGAVVNVRWSPTSEELAGYLRRAESSLTVLEGKARNHHAELISREWRF
jgi:hypothetical protein